MPAVPIPPNRAVSIGAGAKAAEARSFEEATVKDAVASSDCGCQKFGLVVKDAGTVEVGGGLAAMKAFAVVGAPNVDIVEGGRTGSEVEGAVEEKPNGRAGVLLNVARPLNVSKLSSLVLVGKPHAFIDVEG